MQIDSSQWRRRRLRISMLVPHPAQRDFVEPTIRPEQQEAFCEVIKREGQREPVHVLPEGNRAGLPGGTILDGVRRTRALAAIGQDRVDAIVRYDLMDASAEEVEHFFLGFNGDRGQLHPLDMARVVLRRFEIEKGQASHGLRRADEGEARDRVGRSIGMSGRNLQRYFRVLLTPLEIQLAVRDGKLPLVMGEKVEGLSKNQQAEIARRIGAGETPTSVVADYVTRGNGRHRKAGDAFSCFTKNLEAALADLEDRPDMIYRGTLRQCTPLLKRARRLIDTLIAEGRKKTGALAELAKNIGADDDE